MEWISVDDKLPKNGTGIIACYEDIFGKYRVSEAYYRDGFESPFDEVDYLEYMKRTTHWMPLPEPPLNVN